MNYETIYKITQASGVCPGELILVHFWGEDALKEQANHFLKAVAALGATPLLLQQSRSINREIFSSASESCYDQKFFDALPTFDAVLDVFTYRPVILGYELPETQQALYRRYISQLFYKLTQCKRFTQIRIPTEQNAEESGLPAEEYISRMNRAYDVDYGQLKTACEAAVKSFNGRQKIRIVTGENCELYLEITGRSWHVDAGDGDMPCGEIYIAPLEQKTRGSITFEALKLNGECYRNVILFVNDGEITSANHEAITGFFSGQPKENRILCELGLGMNPNITDFCGYSLLDEKRIGSFHIGIGDNTLFGGTNNSSLHIDFVGIGKVEGV